MGTTAFISGFSEIAPQYQALICDIWGVLHDGRRAHAGAVDALRRFRGEGKTVVLLSNAPRLRRGVEEQFVRLGVPLDCYDDLMTSGEATRSYLAEQSRQRTLKIFYLGPDRDLPMFAGLDIALVGTDEAELVLNVGPFNDDTETPDDYRDRLAAFRGRNLPMICANPDLIVQRGSSVIYCAGSLAKKYEEIGGKVLYFGKPHRAVFDMALTKARVPTSKVLMVGDGLGTDIKGANAAGIDALFILSGVHAPADDGEKIEAAAQRMLAENGATARAVMMHFTW